MTMNSFTVITHRSILTQNGVIFPRAPKLEPYHQMQFKEIFLCGVWNLHILGLDNTTVYWFELY